MTYNQKLLQMWNVDDEDMVNYISGTLIPAITDQLKDTDDFLSKTEKIYAHPNEKSSDTLEFKDGRIRPWSFKGLFISREIVAAHSGTISVESEIGKGSTFTVSLPIEKIKEEK